MIRSYQTKKVGMIQTNYTPRKDANKIYRTHKKVYLQQVLNAPAYNIPHNPTI